MKKYKLGIIGIGVMGQAIMHCALSKKIISKSELALFDVSNEQLDKFKGEIKCFDSAQELISNCEFVLIAIKPQHFDTLSNSVKVTEENTILSIMAGTTVAKIRNKLNTKSGITRIMPNTPCRIGSGVCALYFDNVSDDKKSFIKSLFLSCGDIVEVEEKDFDAVTGVSGSGPAYVFMFLDGMIQGGVKGGLSYEQSKKLAIATIVGAAKLAETDTASLNELTERVCSKGGTTIEAVKVYREKDLQGIIVEGIDACIKRSEELSKS